jgi:hypothetical protein
MKKTLLIVIALRKKQRVQQNPVLEIQRIKKFGKSLSELGRNSLIFAFWIVMVS